MLDALPTITSREVSALAHPDDDGLPRNPVRRFAMAPCIVFMMLPRVLNAKFFQLNQFDA